MEFIFFIFIIIFISICSNIKPSINSTNMRSILLNKCGLKNIQCKTNSKKEIYYTGMKQGEEYIVLTKYMNRAINQNTIYDIKSIMNSKHYHSGIVIVNNTNNIKDNVKSIAEENGIEIIGMHVGQTSSQEPVKDRYQKNYRQEENLEPIQNGSKANSILGNFFNNRIEKL